MQKHRIIVVGNGMVGHRYLEELVDKADLSQYDVTVFGAEPRDWLLQHELIPLDMQSAWRDACKTALDLIATSAHP